MDVNTADEPLSRRELLAVYPKYCEDFKIFEDDKAKFMAKPDNEVTEQEASAMFSRYKALEKRILALGKSMEAMFAQAKHDVEHYPDDIVTVDDEDEDGEKLGVMDADEAARVQVEVIERHEAWKDRYEDIRNNVGYRSLEAVEQLWSDLDGIKKGHRSVVRARALLHGRKKEANLRDMVMGAPS
ncbi:MAG: hypothetical protein Q9162_006699 [Coniocarpon cinnabarinum]